MDCFKLSFLRNCFFALSALPVIANAAIEEASPETVGLSSERLERIAPAMQSYIDSGKLAGMSTLIARNGRIAHFEVQGQRNLEQQLPMEKDTIFRIYSMTKPITAVAALTLWEQGKFHMADPIAWYLPELASLKVYVSGSGENMLLEDTEQPIRIIDLFLHTAGFSYGFTGSEVDKLYRENVPLMGSMTSDDVLKRLATLPLSHQPGTAWQYGVNIDVLGFLVERLSGKKLGEYMQEVIFEPLEMHDTAFYVPADKMDRFAEVYTPDQTGKTVWMENEPLGDYSVDPVSQNGGGGLVSTMSDYLRFAQMLLNGGELEGNRILGPKTVEYMRTNHLPKALIPYESAAPGQGYGLGVSVTVDTEQTPFMASEGNYGWGGMASTYMRIDPVENLIILGMAQFVPIGFHRYHDDLRNLTYQAVIE